MINITWIDTPGYISQEFIDDISKHSLFKIYKDLPDKNELIKRLNSCDIAIVEWSTISADILENVHRCKYIILPTTSTHQVDDKFSSSDYGIQILNCPKYSSRAVAEWLFSALTALNRFILPSYRKAKQGAKEDYEPFCGLELKGKVLGLVGTGHIAKELISIGKAFEMEIIGCNNSNRSIEQATITDLKTVLGSSDFITIQVPLNTSTRGMINEHVLSFCKKDICIASCSKSEIIDLNYLSRMLEKGNIRGAALDQVAVDSTHPIFHQENVIINTHIAWFTNESRRRNLSYIADIIKSCTNRLREKT